LKIIHQNQTIVYNSNTAIHPALNVSPNAKVDTDLYGIEIGAGFKAIFG